MKTARNYRALRWAAFVAAVLGLHGAALWALQLGLMRQTADTASALADSVIKVVVSRVVPVPQPAAAPSPPAEPPVKAQIQSKPVREPVIPAAMPHTMPAPVRPALLPDQPARVPPPVSEPVEQTMSTPTGLAQSALFASSSAAQTDTALAESASPDGTGPSAPAQGSAVPPLVDADYLYKPVLVYPLISQLRHESGTVMVSVLIGVDGQAQKAKIKQSSGYARLDEEALSAAWRARYRPVVMHAGVPVAMWRDAVFEFALRE